MYKDIEKILLSSGKLQALVDNVSRLINSDFSGEEVILVGMLKGSVVFMSDLMRRITVPCEIDFMVVSSYGCDTVSSGRVEILKDLSVDIEGKNVIIVEDIVDSGNTLSCVLEILKRRNPSKLKVCSLLSKPSRRVNEIKIDYLGTEIPDEFVVGYGMDYAERYRNLPYIGILKRKPDVAES